MKLIIAFIIVTAGLANGQIPKSGTYTYDIAFSEWGGKSNGATCTVIIKGDSIKVLHNGTGNLTGKREIYWTKELLRNIRKPENISLLELLKTKTLPRQMDVRDHQ